MIPKAAPKTKPQKIIITVKRKNMWNKFKKLCDTTFGPAVVNTGYAPITYRAFDPFR